MTMLRVYCTWPGVSAMMNLRLGRREVAVGHVDRDALLALGAEAVGQQREVGVVVAPGQLVASTASSWSSKIDLESSSSRPMRVDLPSSTEPAVAKREQVHQK